MKEKSKIKAEDILMQDGEPSDVLYGKNADESEDEVRERQLARRIYYYLINHSKTSLPNDEKSVLKSQIVDSVNQYRRSRRVRVWSAVAAILIIGFVGVLWYSQVHETPAVVKFAENTSVALPVGDTRLILQNGQEIRIDKKQSKIQYGQNGKDISIDASQKVKQSLESKKIVYNTVVVPYGKRTEITLSDGTNVWLNSGTRLVYPAVFAKNKREVYIDGEAVFEVKHSDVKPFLVNSRDFTVRVMGTVFNVSAYSDDQYSSAVLERGKIELSYKGNSLLHKEKTQLSPGDMAIYNPGKKEISEKRVNPADYLSWRMGYYVFRSERLDNILKKLARYYDVEIKLQNTELGEQTFSGSLDLKKTPEDVLKVIQKTTSLTFSCTKDEIIIN
ncbi:iron dicitrate transporter FecR [Prolixibacter bellariivorans]|uniref:Iron dicitrate transporter FecR n=1 Tax=Prolixibacter bellariivorans TaxID=314319 RepID=A0A5M4B5S8_9BACT|nr:FecR domain-containing protein [Prolixibacter bellariivorans]GET35178.1 iron dicitrate transporter FecR [Prolixibacter bellariivorans]